MFSEPSSTFYAAPRIKVGTRLFNGDTDNKYWIVGRLEGGNEWRGPFVSLSLANDAALIMLDKYVIPGINLETFVRVEVGKRYWLQDNRTWFLRTEKAYTQVRQLPADEPGPDPTPTVPVTTARFGFIHDKYSYPQKGRLPISGAAPLGENSTENNRIFGRIPGGYGLRSQADIDADKVYWLPSASFGFNADTISAGNNCIVGPTILQDVYQYASKAAVRGNTSDDIQIIVDRPVTDVPDDDGSDGYYLAGYTVGWGYVKRFVRALTRTRAYSPAFETQVPSVMDWNITTSGDLSLNQAIAKGGTNIFHFASVETLKTAPIGTARPSPYVCTYTGPSAGTVVPPGMIQLDDLVFPNMPFGLSDYVICNCSCYAVVDYLIRAAFVTRVDGIATYNYSDPLTARVCVFPFPVEPPVIYSNSITAPYYGLGATIPGVNGTDLTMGVSWRMVGGVRDYAAHPDGGGSLTPFVFTPFDNQSITPQCNWSDVPNVGGYIVTEEWGKYLSDVTQKPKPITDKTWWTVVKDETQPYHVFKSWGLEVPKSAMVGPYGEQVYNGAICHLRAYPKVPPFGNGGSCPYPMPRGDAAGFYDYGLSCLGVTLIGATNQIIRIINGNNIQGQIVNGDFGGNVRGVDYYEPPQLQYGPIPVIPRFRYWGGTAGIWIVDPGQQPPPYDNGSSAYLATMIDGSKAYWYLGDQGNQALPGHGVIGWGYAIPTPTLGIAYTRPYYASGPFQFYINSDTNTPVNPQSPRDYIPGTGDVLDPTGSVGFITVPTAGTDPGTGLPNFEIVYLYSSPQKKSVI